MTTTEVFLESILLDEDGRTKTIVVPEWVRTLSERVRCTMISSGRVTFIGEEHIPSGTPATAQFTIAGWPYEFDIFHHSGEKYVVSPFIPHDSPLCKRREEKFEFDNITDVVRFMREHMRIWALKSLQDVFGDEEEDRSCTCGSGEPWTTCHTGSSNCG